MMCRAQAFQGRDTAAMTEYLDWMRKNYQVYRWLAVVNADGRIIAATNPASVGKDMSRTHLFRVVREQGGVHIQDVEVSEDAGGIPVIGFSGPILDAQEKFRGAILSQVTLSSVEDVASAAIHTFQVQRGSTGKIEYQILNRDGDLLGIRARRNLDRLSGRYPCGGRGDRAGRPGCRSATPRTRIAAGRSQRAPMRGRSSRSWRRRGRARAARASGPRACR